MRGESERCRGGDRGRRPCSGAVRGRPSPGGPGVPIAPTAFRPAGDATLRGRRGGSAASSRRPVLPQAALTRGGGESCDATLAAAAGEGVPAIRLHDYIAPGQRREAGLHPFGSSRSGSPAPGGLSRTDGSASRWQPNRPSPRTVPSRASPRRSPHRAGRLPAEPEAAAGRARWQYFPSKWQYFPSKWQLFAIWWQFFGP